MPAGEDYPLSGLFGMVRAGRSVSSALKAFREAGGKIGNESFRSLYATARTVLDQELREAQRPLNRRPSADERVAMRTRVATGVMQRVGVFVRDKGSRQVRLVFGNVTSARGMTRQAAIDSILDDYADAIAEGSFDESIVGAFHVGAYDLNPL